MASQYHPLVQGFPELAVQGNDFAGVLNSLITTIIGLAGILAVLMIVVGGIQYVSTDAWQGKTDGKKRIQAALGGLLLALSSYLLLNTIDPSLTQLNFADKLTSVGPLQNASSSGVTVIPQGEQYDYDTNESAHLDPTGQTGGIVSGTVPAGNTSIDTCEGLQEYRSNSLYSANDKGGTSGSVASEVAWLMRAVPQKWPGLTVMSTYRSPKWNLTSAYGVPSAKADQIIAELATTDGSYSARVALANKYGIKRAALTSRHVMGRAVDFAGPGLSNGQVDQLVTWARSGSCISITEVIWQAPGHYDHVHLGV